MAAAMVAAVLLVMSAVADVDGTTFFPTGQALQGQVNMGSNGGMGTSVAIVGGEVVVVGAPGVNGNSGVAWIFTYSAAAATWLHDGAGIVPVDATGASQFGSAVAASPLTVVVGGPSDNATVGAVFVFGRNVTTGGWSQQGGKLIPTGSDGGMGQMVAVSSDGATLVAGAPNGNSVAYVFTKTGAGWALGATLTPPMIFFIPGEVSAVAVSADGAVVVMGCVGGALVFTRTATAALYVQHGPEFSLPFDASVALVSAALSADGLTVAVAYPSVANETVLGFVFTMSSATGVWDQQGNELVTSVSANYILGGAVAVSGDGSVVLIGAGNEDVFAFTRSGGFAGSWAPLPSQSLFASPSIYNPAEFGSALAIAEDGSAFVVGALADYAGGEGGAYVYTAEAQSPNCTRPLDTLSTTYSSICPVSIANGATCTPVCASGYTLVGNSSQICNNGVLSFISTPAGRCDARSIVAAPSSSVYKQVGAKLVNISSAGSYAQEGAATACSETGDVVAVSNPVALGSVFIFTRNSPVYVQEGPALVPVDSVGSSVAFGGAIAMSGSGGVLVVGGAGDVSNGAAWIFTRAAVSGGGWQWAQQNGKLVGQGTTSSPVNQGGMVAVSLDGVTAVSATVSAADEDIFVFTNTGGGVWQQQEQLHILLAGTGVAMSGNGNVLVAAVVSDTLSGDVVFIFTRASGAWSQQSPGVLYQGFSVTSPPFQTASVSISADGTAVALGAYNDTSASGVVFVFTLQSAGGYWEQQGPAITPAGTGATGFADAVSLSGTGSVLVVGAARSNGNNGSVAVFLRDPSSGVWAQKQPSLVGSGYVQTSHPTAASGQGVSVAVSSDGSTIVFGATNDGDGANQQFGAAWVFALPTSSSKNCTRPFDTVSTLYAEAGIAETVVNGTTVTPICAAGYSPTANLTITCLDGAFTTPAGTCQGSVCVAPSPSSWSTTNYSSCGVVANNAACEVSCLPNFVNLSAPLVVTCYDGVFTASPCVAMPCTAPADTNATVYSNSYSCHTPIANGTLCTPRCAAGYGVVGGGGGGGGDGGGNELSRLCLYGVLQPPARQCVSMNCTTPANTASIKYTAWCGSTMTSGTVCQPRCASALEYNATSLAITCLNQEISNCTDGQQNGFETDVDCGGPACPACPPQLTLTPLQVDHAGMFAYVNKTTSPLLQMSGDDNVFTLEIKVQFRSHLGGTEAFPLFADLDLSGDGSDGGAGIVVDPSMHWGLEIHGAIGWTRGETVAFYSGPPTLATQPDAISSGSAAPLALQQWYSLSAVVVVTATTVAVTLYQDGATVFQQAIGLSINQTSVLPWAVAQDGTLGYGGAGYPPDMLLDDVRLWNTIRTQSQIQSAACVGVAGQSGLVLYLTFNVSQGSVQENRGAAGGSALLSNRTGLFGYSQRACPSTTLPSGCIPISAITASPSATPTAAPSGCAVPSDGGGVRYSSPLCPATLSIHQMCHPQCDVGYFTTQSQPFTLTCVASGLLTGVPTSSSCLPIPATGTNYTTSCGASCVTVVQGTAANATTNITIGNVTVSIPANLSDPNVVAVVSVNNGGGSGGVISGVVTVDLVNTTTGQVINVTNVPGIVVLIPFTPPPTSANSTSSQHQNRTSYWRCSSFTAAVTCSYYNEACRCWTEDGVTTEMVADGVARCTTTHLTDFGVLEREYESGSQKCDPYYLNQRLFSGWAAVYLTMGLYSFVRLGRCIAAKAMWLPLVIFGAITLCCICRSIILILGVTGNLEAHVQRKPAGLVLLFMLPFMFLTLALSSLIFFWLEISRGEAGSGILPFYRYRFVATCTYFVGIVAAATITVLVHPSSLQTAANITSIIIAASSGAMAVIFIYSGYRVVTMAMGFTGHSSAQTDRKVQRLFWTTANASTGLLALCGFWCWSIVNLTTFLNAFPVTESCFLAVEIFTCAALIYAFRNAGVTAKSSPSQEVSERSSNIIPPWPSFWKGSRPGGGGKSRSVEMSET